MHFAPLGLIALGGGIGAAAAGPTVIDDPGEDPDGPRRTVVIAADYCSEDGTTDDGPNIQRAVDDLAAQGGGELRFTPGKTYFWNTDVVIAAAGKEIKVVMTGAKFVAGPSAVDILTISGTRRQLGGNQAYGPTDIGATVIPVSSALSGSLSPGDWVMVWSSDVDNPERPRDYFSGEEAVISAVSSSELETTAPLRLAHTQRSQRRLFKLDMAIRPTVEGGNFKLHNKGSRQIAVAIRYAYFPTIDSVHVSGKSGRYGVHIDQCIQPALSQISGVDIYDAANGTAPNGVAVYLNGVVGAAVADSRGTRCRHSIDINSYSSSDKPGFVSRDVVVTNQRAIRTYGPGWTTHHVRGVTFDNPISIDCGGGGQLRGYGSTLIRPSVRGGNRSKPDEWNDTRYVTAGIAFGETDSLPQGDGFAAAKVLIDHPQIENLPSGWREISYSDDPEDFVIIQP